jgi:adenylyltransferase/sulfurtransferase
VFLHGDFRSKLPSTKHDQKAVPVGSAWLPPLIEPDAPLTTAELRRTQRQTRLPGLGETGQRRLAAARVLVVGAGGLGAPVLQYLAAAGVGTIGVVDDDLVSESNLHRQVIHDMASVGSAKVISAARRIEGLAPEAVVEPFRLRLDESNAASLISGYDLVVDGADNFATRYLVNDTCAELGVPLVWGSVLQFDAQVSVFWSHPPAGFPAVTLRDLFPTPPAPDSVPSCAEAGVLGALCGIVGSMMATEAVKLITGLGRPLLGRVAAIDALSMRVREIPLEPGPAVAARQEAVPACRTGFVVHNEHGDRLTGNGYRHLLADRAPTALLDVREPSEYATDPLPDALNLPVSELVHAARGGAARVTALLAAAGVPDGTRIVTYCRAGVRAAEAVRVLGDAGWRAHALLPDAVAELRAEAVRR